jgi:hypothetical protein
MQSLVRFTPVIKNVLCCLTRSQLVACRLFRAEHSTVAMYIHTCKQVGCAGTGQKAADMMSGC